MLLVAAELIKCLFCCFQLFFFLLVTSLRISRVIQMRHQETYLLLKDITVWCLYVSYFWKKVLQVLLSAARKLSGQKYTSSY